MHGPGDGERTDGDQSRTAARAPTDLMQRAIAAAELARGSTTPNPWVGSVLVSGLDPSLVFEGATAPREAPTPRSRRWVRGRAQSTLGAPRSSPPSSPASTRGGHRPVLM